jgi:capsular exopolysaccharide synthesis family protein
LTRYLYLEAAKRAKKNKKKRTRRQKADETARDSKQPDAGMTPGNVDRSGKAASEKPADHSYQELLLPSPRKAPALVSPNGWYELQNKLLSRNLQSPLRTLMFTGVDHGIGVTTAVINFGRALAGSTGSKVLIIDANLRTPQLHSIFNLNPANGVAEVFANNGLKTYRFKEVGEKQLFVFTCGESCSERVNYFEPKGFDALLQKASDKFDYTIIDSAPISRFADSLAICSRVDGVLLVIEAGKTRPQVALRAKMELEEAGAKLLGVILNKRKYYIPEWIYRRL